MTGFEPNPSQLPLAPARRAGVCAALLQAAASHAMLQRLARHHGAVVVDDLCRLAMLAEAQGISDAALACAAAETSPAVSGVARMVYAARLHLRDAGFATPLGQPVGGANGAPQRLTCASLQAAVDALRDVGITASRAPRGLFGKLSSLAARPAPLRGAVARMLKAAFFGATQDIVAALCPAPFCIELADLHAAFSPRHADRGRDAVAAALRALRGTRAKEAALAAASALEAAVAVPEVKEFSLHAALQSVHSAILQWAQRDGSACVDDDLPAMLRAAASADRVWANLQNAPGPAVRVATLLDGLASLCVADDLELVPYGSGEASEGAAADIRFEDAPGAPVLWDAFAAVLDVAGSKSTRPADEGSFRVDISAPLARAAAAYVRETTRVARRRVCPQPEAPSSLTAPPMTFSASRLNAFVKCPRRWFYEYLCEVLEDAVSLHAAYGRVVHDALEALHREIRVPGRHDASVILERLLRELDVAFGRSRAVFGSQLEYEVSRYRARRMAEQYVRWLTLEAARAPFEIVSVEVLQRQRFGGHEFVGYVDRIDRPLSGGPITIFDYKTGRIETNAHEYLDKVRRGEEAQLALYYAMRRAAGDEIARIALVSIRDPRDDVWILALDIVDDGGKAVVEPEPVDGVLRAACSRADLDASLAALIERCDFLTQRGLEHFPAGDDPPCNFCAYARACRDRPADGERIFAR